MSTDDFIKNCNKEQLQYVIEMAQAKLKRISEETFVPIWVITDGFINDAAFDVDSYDLAVKKLADIVLKNIGSGQEIEWRLLKVKLRESEAQEMLTL